MKLPEKPPEWKKALNNPEKTFGLLKERNSLNKIYEFNNEHYYWEEVRHRIGDKEESEYIWSLMKNLRSVRYRTIPYQAIRLKYTTTPKIDRQLHIFDQLLSGNIILETRTLTHDKKYLISSLMEEAIASSILEGAATTREKAKEMLRTNRKPQTKSEKMVKNGYETMQIILEKKSEKLTPEFLLEIQSSITKDTLDDEKYTGNFRDNNDVIICDDIDPSIIYHIPPDYKKIENMIKELCEFANNEEDEFIHPIIKGIILHFLIGYIHPFNDGNGRTARSIFYWYVLKKGYWLFEYMPVSRMILHSKTKYGLAYLYTEYDELDLTYFIKYIADCIEKTIEDLKTYIERKQKEQNESIMLLNKTQGITYRQADILKKIIDTKSAYHTIEEISTTYKIVYETARSDLLDLYKKGYISMKKIGRKFVFYLDDQNRKKIEETKQPQNQ